MITAPSREIQHFTVVYRTRRAFDLHNRGMNREEAEAKSLEDCSSFDLPKDTVWPPIPWEKFNLIHPRVDWARDKFNVIAKDEKLDTHAHLPFLKSVAKGNVLEIGVHCGISTTALLAGLEEHGGHLWSVDVHPSCRYVWYGHPQWTFLCPWIGDNADALQVERGLDVLFIDGDHSYAGIMHDLETHGPKVNPGGLILCHDADTPSFPGVRNAIEEYCNARGLKHELRPGSNGLEVIYV